MIKFLNPKYYTEEEINNSKNSCIFSKLPNEVITKIFCFLDEENCRYICELYPFIGLIYENNYNLIKKYQKQTQYIIDIKYNKDKIRSEIKDLFPDYIKLLIVCFDNPYERLEKVSNFLCPDCDNNLKANKILTPQLQLYLSIECNICYWRYIKDSDINDWYELRSINIYKFDTFDIWEKYYVKNKINIWYKKDWSNI